MRRTHFVIALAGLALSACGTPTWSYEGSTGPEHWGDLSEEWILCKTGKRQSPIDLTAGAPGTVPELRFEYGATPLRILNNGKTIQVNYAAGSALVVDGERYRLEHFNFHSPSEHTIGGKQAAMEVHFVNRNARGDVVILAVLLNEGRANAAIAPIWKHVPDYVRSAIEVAEAHAKALDLIPGNKERWHYDGSLTTPPGTENVKWIVLKTPLQVSREQVEFFRNLIGRNARPTQPLHGREVEFGK